MLVIGFFFFFVGTEFEFKASLARQALVSWLYNMSLVGPIIRKLFLVFLVFVLFSYKKAIAQQM
jgi:hypothetical protein